ncbi:MAG: FIST C-terminal domain-containing protein [Treponema sp.]|jgi:hypothetical protein|nr:FIST C-terminal domain-containing protein [Treponema sp.]
MIRFFTAFTFEIDDPLLAADEIRKQLDPEHSLLGNSAGLLFCSLDFVTSGAAAAVSKALPFGIIGCTTHGIVVPGGMSEVMLAVMVLTSDDAFFKIGVSDSLDEDGETRIREVYTRLSGPSESPPSLILACYSNPNYFSGDEALNILDRVSGGIPVFGTSALDETFGRRKPMIIHNGTAYSDRLALLTICGGDQESRFNIKFLPAINFSGLPAVVTEARGNRLISINKMPAAEFMEKVGIIAEGKLNTIYGFPLMVNNNDGTGPKSCGIYGIEDGGVLCCGSTIVKGATLKLVNQMREEVLSGSKHFVESIRKESGKKAHLICSCFGRGMSLVDLKDEMGLFQKHIEEQPYIFIYSAGEFCPVYDEVGGIRNGFYQYSIAAVSF